MGHASSTMRRQLASMPVGLAAVLCLATVLRFYDLDRTSLWYDEAISWYQASLAFWEMIAATAQDNYPPLHNLLLHLTIRISGDSETALRAPSALLSLLDVYFIYRIGWELWNRKTGLLAALLLAIAGFHIWYATEARNYALLSAAASAYFWTALQLARRPTFQRYAWNLAAGIALLYSHVFGTVIFSAVGIFTLFVLRSPSIGLNLPWRRWLALQCTAGLLFIPWALLLLLRFQEVKQGFWVREATVLHVVGQLAALMGGPASASATCLLAGLAFFDLDKPTGAIRRLIAVHWQLLLLLAWFLSSVLFALAVSKTSVSIFADRYLIGGLPALYLLAARGLLNLGGHRRAQQLALGVLLVTFMFPLYRYAFVQEREDNRGGVSRSVAPARLPVLRSR
jgi:uncharacterized membrane protein